MGTYYRLAMITHSGLHDPYALSLTQSCGVLKGGDAEEIIPDVRRRSVLIHASILP
jgi:hypothetical protein